MPKILSAREKSYRLIKEKELQKTVIEMLQNNGYELVFHDTDSRMNNPGFPDLVAIRLHPPDIFIGELKKELGKTTEIQEKWLEAFNAVGIEAKVYRPSDLDRLQERLKRA